MPRYRLGAHQLPAAEVILFRTLMRLFASDPQFRWHFVDEAPFDALVVDAAAADAQIQSASKQAHAVLMLVRALDPEGLNSISRPVRADRLKQWLMRVEAELGVQSAGTLNPASPVSAFPTVPSSIAPAEVSSPVALAQDDAETAYKLRRWPPVTLLQRDPVRIRMATLMSRKFLKLSDLASITGLSEQEVRPFVQNLQVVGLIESKREMPTVERAAVIATQFMAPTAQNQPTQKAEKGFFGKGLISGIRKRLGL